MYKLLWSFNDIALCPLVLLPFLNNFCNNVSNAVDAGVNNVLLKMKFGVQCFKVPVS